jgi:Trypsin
MKTKLLLATCLMALKAQAFVINPDFDSYDPAVVKLSGEALCSGSVVGLRPLTVLTAKHCVTLGATNLGADKPIKIFQKNYPGFPFDVNQNQTPGDIAVLVFSEAAAPALREMISQDDLFHLETQKIEHGTEVSFCGYGGTLPIKGDYTSGKLHCGKNYLVNDDKNLTFKKDIDALMTSSFTIDEASEVVQSKYIHANIQMFLGMYGAGTRIAFGILEQNSVATPFSKIDKSFSMARLQQGDSGGPMFIRDGSDKKQIIGVNSIVGFANFMGSYQPLIGVGWRVDHRFSRELLREAKLAGADL